MTEHLEVPHLRFLLAVAVTPLIRIIFITQAHTLGAFIPKGWKITPPQLIDALCQPSNPLIINAMRSMEKRYCDHELLPGNPLI